MFELNFLFYLSPIICTISNGVNYSSGLDWTNAMNDDRIISQKESPTAYGENSPIEDFAESVAEFVSDPIGFEKNFPNRARLLKQIFM